jgi:hypothetical protein
MTATRFTPGAISLSSSSHFPVEYRESGGVAARPRQARDEASANRVGDIHKYDRHRARRLSQRPGDRRADGQDHIRCQHHQFGRVSTNAVRIARSPAGVDPHVAAVDPAQLL